MPSQPHPSQPDVRSLGRVEACIRLGRKMAGTLERHATADSPERRLAAEISALADGLTGLASGDLERRATPLVEAVTALWAYRCEFPKAARPFPMFEPALHAVQYLERGPQRCNDATYIAGQIDGALVFLINASLSKAVSLAVDNAAEWIDLANQAGFGDCFELAAVHRLAQGHGLEDPEPKCDSEGDAGRVGEKLEVIIALATQLKPQG